jgi:hypothetical protein
MQEADLSEPKQYWFPAMRYGWGWGLPIAWQGWVAWIAFLGLMVAGDFIFPPNEDILRFALYAAVVVVIFVATLFAKGEPPKWRWRRRP